jgi:hypothetical protein
LGTLRLLSPYGSPSFNSPGLRPTNESFNGFLTESYGIPASGKFKFKGISAGSYGGSGIFGIPAGALILSGLGILG